MYSRVGLFVGLMAALLTGGCGTAVNTLDCELNPLYRGITPPPSEDTGTSQYGTDGKTGPLWSVSEEHKKQIYGGVLDDLEIMWLARSSTPQHDLDPLWGLLDMPFSAIGDTFTLPYILAYQYGLMGTSAKASPADSYPSITPPVDPSTPPVDPPK